MPKNITDSRHFPICATCELHADAPKDEDELVGIRLRFPRAGYPTFIRYPRGPRPEGVTIKEQPRFFGTAKAEIFFFFFFFSRVFRKTPRRTQGRSVCLGAYDAVGREGGHAQLGGAERFDVR